MESHRFMSEFSDYGLRGSCCFRTREDDTWPEMKEKGYVPQTKVVLYDLDAEEKETIVLGHSEN
ncbi:hypothetical protein CUMW_119270 [Citrus unshiu]|nr:hypothetical protein CUMW_119270 [Citrus unshiu]